VSDATAASKDRNNPIFCAVSDAAVVSDTENHGSCKQTFSQRAKAPLSKVNNRPIGQSSPNLVTLLLQQPMKN
jgi:hypothetical protein